MPDCYDDHMSTVRYDQRRRSKNSESGLAFLSALPDELLNHSLDFQDVQSLCNLRSVMSGTKSQEQMRYHVYASKRWKSPTSLLNALQCDATTDALRMVLRSKVRYLSGVEPNQIHTMIATYPNLTHVYSNCTSGTSTYTCKDIAAIGRRLHSSKLRVLHMSISCVLSKAFFPRTLRDLRLQRCPRSVGDGPLVLDMNIFPRTLRRLHVQQCDLQGIFPPGLKHLHLDTENIRNSLEIADLPKDLRSLHLYGRYDGIEFEPCAVWHRLDHLTTLTLMVNHACAPYFTKRTSYTIEYSSLPRNLVHWLSAFTAPRDDFGQLPVTLKTLHYMMNASISPLPGYLPATLQELTLSRNQSLELASGAIPDGLTQLTIASHCFANKYQSAVIPASVHSLTFIDGVRGEKLYECDTLQNVRKLIMSTLFEEDVEWSKQCPGLTYLKLQNSENQRMLPGSYLPLTLQSMDCSEEKVVFVEPNFSGMLDRLRICIYASNQQDLVSQLQSLPHAAFLQLTIESQAFMYDMDSADWTEVVQALCPAITKLEWRVPSMGDSFPDINAWPAGLTNLFIHHCGFTLPVPCAIPDSVLSLTISGATPAMMMVTAESFPRYLRALSINGIERPFSAFARCTFDYAEID
jgi:hypothetical protein